MSNIRPIDKKYRNSDFYRKPGSFKEVDEEYKGTDPIRIPVCDASVLGIFDAYFLNINDPFDEIEPYDEDDMVMKVPMIFILRLDDGKTYLVNTEGYNYCRYVMPCVVY